MDLHIPQPYSISKPHRGPLKGVSAFSDIFELLRIDYCDVKCNISYVHNTSKHYIPVGLHSLNEMLSNNMNYALVDARFIQEGGD